MKKLNKLFAILIAVLGVQTLSAQTDVTSTYLTNANFSSTSGWTQYVSGDFRDIGSGNIGGKLGNHAASSTDATHLSSEYFFGFQCRWSGRYSSYNQETSQALPSGVYTLSYDVENVNGSTSAVNYNNLFYVKVGDKTFTDTSVEWMKGKSSWTSHSITFVITEATKATVSLGYGTGSNNLASGNTPVLYVSHLKLTYRDIDDISAKNPADLTSYIVNNSFETGNLDGWTYIGSTDTGVKPNSNGTYTTTGVDGNYLFNTWWKGTPLTQTVTNIPNGIYVLNVLVASGDGADKAKPNIFLTANGEHSTAYNISDGNNKIFHDVSYEFKVLNGQATIGVIGGNDAGEYVDGGHWWYKADNFRLTYKGADVSLLQEAFAANYAKLEALSTDDVPTAFETQITSLKSTYTTMPSSKAELNTANGEMEAIIAAHPSIVASYALLNELITLCNTYVTENYSSVKEENTRSTFTTAISTATTDKENATTAAKLTEAYNTLEAARQTFILAAYPTDGNSFDMTFKITNPSFETGNATGWKVINSSDTGVKPNSNATYATSGVDGNYLFNNFWQGTPLTQALSNMPNGIYELKVLVASDGCTVYLTADDEHNDGTDTYSTGSGLFVEATMTFTCTDGNVVIGVVGGADGEASAHKEFTANGYWWYKADNFRLTRTFNTADMQSVLTDLLTEANTMANQPIDANIKEALNSTIQATDATATDPATLDNMINVLTEAMASAEASINDYAKLKRYIDMTAVFTDVTSYTTKYNNGEYASTDVETTRQELNVLRFEAASAIYKNKVDVTGWTGSMGERSDQHWSGTAKSYKDANSWDDIQDDALTTTVHLIKGSYVLKVAGRSATENARLTLEVLGNTIEFHAKGDTGYGIDTDGKANFSSEGTYANDGKGRGWEWEFLKFTLDEDQDVTLSVNSYYNNTWQVWNSFGDISLWMDEGTFMAVYGEKLNEPLADAKAMVNTKPMGTAENNALLAAIELSNTFEKTPEGLNGAVDALTEAVANAKAWVTAYNEAKVPLVAALERFEADYNDAQNGVLSHLYMCKNLWTAAINMAKAAADAKDVLNSYDGFETAAENLNDALDAVTRSDGEYEALDAAIKTASSLYSGGNWGEQAFQRPTSAKENLNTKNAQDTYDAAEADGEAVTSVTGALNNGLNGIVLNAPKEGTCYKIVMGDLTWTNNDNATMLSTKDKSLVFVKGGQSEVQGLYSINFIGKNNNYAHALIFNAVKNKINQYTISFIDNDGATRYICDGSVTGAGTGVYGIRTTTDAANALPVEVRATATEGVWNLYNTVAKELLGAQDAGFFTTTRNNNLKIMEAPKNEVTLTFSSVGWATLILPFDAELPEGVLAYSCGDTDETEGTLTLEEAESLKANTPYLMNSYGKDFTFSGYGLATKDSYTDGLFTGTYENYKTTNDGKTYVLQNINGEVAFYLVGEKAQPTVKPNRIYMTYESTNGAAAPRFSFGRGEGTTSVDNMEPTANSQQPIVVYDLMGRKVTTMEKGGMYIVNGKKVVIK